MAKSKASSVKTPKEKSSAATIFDYLSWLTDKKKKWEELSPQDKKGFNVFIVNRFLSMDLYLCEAINDMQEYTLSMDKRMVWRLYYEILPKQKLFVKYIKSSKVEGINEKDVAIFVKHFQCKEEDAIEYLQLLTKKGLQEEISKIIINYESEKK